MRSTQRNIQWVLGFFLGVKWPGREANLSHPSVSSFRMSGAKHQLPIYTFMAWTWTALSSMESKATDTAKTIVLLSRQRLRNGPREANFVLQSDSPTSPGKYQGFGETYCLFAVSF